LIASIGLIATGEGGAMAGDPKQAHS
jgi:hypothetical protein